MQIIEYKEKYRDDMIFIILEAKNALGKIPSINTDLLDIDSYYIQKGNKFWLMLNGEDRVIGCI